jgi:lysine-N-methylase
VEVVAPAYLARFRCIGSACEDHCCGGWQGVDVDRPTYEAYRAVSEPTLLPLLRDHVRRNEDLAADSTEYATIDVTGDGGCPFLTGERLCAIQGALGEAHLPVTCDTFPRLATLIDGRIDLGARLACPEAARLALLDADAMTPTVVAPDRRLAERGRYWVEAPWLDAPPEGDPRRHYHAVRERVVALLRRRELPLGDRLGALGEAFRLLGAGAPMTEGSAARAFAEAERIVAPPAPGGARGADGARPDGEPLDGAPELLLARLRVWVAMRGVPPRLRRPLDRLRDGLHLPTDPTAPLDARTCQAYAEALERGVRPYLEARPYVLENALVNVVHLSTFPYHPARTFAEELALLACRAGTYLLLLAGAAAVEDGLTDALVVETLQAFEKYADSPDYWDRVLALLHRHDALTPASLSGLLAGLNVAGAAGPGRSAARPSLPAG